MVSHSRNFSVGTPSWEAILAFKVINLHLFTQIIIHTNAARHQIFFQVELKPFRI
jgi:hypothetical protein